MHNGMADGHGLWEWGARLGGGGQRGEIGTTVIA